MSDPSSSSISRSANVTKVLVDLNEYQKLLALKKTFEEKELKLKHQLQDSITIQKGEGPSTNYLDTNQNDESPIESKNMEKNINTNSTSNSGS